jgi:hypothetical protein
MLVYRRIGVHTCYLLQRISNVEFLSQWKIPAILLFSRTQPYFVILHGPLSNSDLLWFCVCRRLRIDDCQNPIRHRRFDVLVLPVKSSVLPLLNSIS